MSTVAETSYLAAIDNGGLFYLIADERIKETMPAGTLIVQIR